MVFFSTCSTCHLRCPAKRLPLLLPRPPGNRHPSIQELYSERRHRQWDQTNSDHTTTLFPTTCYQTCYQYIPHACSQGDKMVTSPFLCVSRKWIPTCCLFGTLLRWISLDQQLSDFHFKGESLPFFPHYVQRIVYMILFYFRFFVCGLIMTSFVLMYQRHYIRSG